MKFTGISAALIESKKIDNLEFNVENGSVFRGLVDNELKLRQRQVRQLYKAENGIMLNDEQRNKLLKIYNTTNNEKIALHPLSKEEIERRIPLHNRAKDVAAKYISTSTICHGIVASFLTANNYSHDRGLIALFRSFGQNPKELIDNLDKFQKASKEDKLKMFDNAVKQSLTNMKEVASLNDEDLMDYVEQKPNAFTVLAEFDGDKIKQAYNAMGFEFSDEMEELITPYKGIANNIGLKTNRIGTMANPLFIKFEEKDSAILSELAEEAEELDPDIAAEISEGLLGTDQVNSIVDFAHGKEELGFKMSVEVGYEQTAVFDRVESALSDTISLQMKTNDAAFYDATGKKLTKDEAHMHFASTKEPLALKDKDGHVINRFMCDRGNNAYIIQDSKPKDIDLTNLNDVKTKLGDMISKTTHWYMPSSPEYKALRLAVENLDKYPEISLDDKLKGIYKLSQDYLNYKYSDKNDKGKSYRTFEREECAMKISNLLKPHIDEAVALDIVEPVEIDEREVDGFVVIDEKNHKPDYDLDEEIETENDKEIELPDIIDLDDDGKEL